MEGQFCNQILNADSLIEENKAGKKNIEDIIKELELKRKECMTNGHKDIFWVQYIPSLKSDPLKDRVDGICTYCSSYVSRALNNEERDSIKRFYENYQEPTTI